MAKVEFEYILYPVLQNYYFKEPFSLAIFTLLRQEQPKMSSNTIQNQQGGANESALHTGNDSFNFDMWAREVKRQMIASIKKRDYKD